MDKYIINDLAELYNNIYIKKTMPKTMSTAITKLIYKKGDRADLKNWRPISLLNTDYKILSKIINNKFKIILQKIISKNQKCGVENRTIDQVIYNIQSAIDSAKQLNKDLSLICIDYEKAFRQSRSLFLKKSIKKTQYPEIPANLD